MIESFKQYDTKSVRRTVINIDTLNTMLLVENADIRFLQRDVALKKAYKEFCKTHGQISIQAYDRAFFYGTKCVFESSSKESAPEQLSKALDIHVITCTWAKTDFGCKSNNSLEIIYTLK